MKKKKESTDYKELYLKERLNRLKIQEQLMQYQYTDLKNNIGEVQKELAEYTNTKNETKGTTKKN